MADQDPERNRFVELREKEILEAEKQAERDERRYRHWFETGSWSG